MDGVAVSAEAIVPRLQVEAAIEVERRAVFVQMGPDAGPVRENEIDLLRAREQGALDFRHGHAFGPFLFDPLDLGNKRPRIDWHAQDHLVLDDEARNRLANNAGLRTDETEQ